MPQIMPAIFESMHKAIQSKSCTATKTTFTLITPPDEGPSKKESVDANDMIIVHVELFLNLSGEGFQSTEIADDSYILIILYIKHGLRTPSDASATRNLSISSQYSTRRVSSSPQTTFCRLTEPRILTLQQIPSCSRADNRHSGSISQSTATRNTVKTSYRTTSDKPRQPIVRYTRRYNNMPKRITPAEAEASPSNQSRTITN
jgi:hypothetical protein